MDENAIPHLPEAVGGSRENGDYLQAALRQAQANLMRYQELFDFAPNGYLVTDWQGIIQEANYAAAAMLGSRREFLVNKPMLFYVAEGDRRTLLNKLAELRHQADFRLQWEMLLCPPRGPRLLTLVTVASAPNDRPEISLRWILQDITYYRQAEETLRAEKEFADSLIELADAVILVFDPAMRIVRTNRYLLALTGYSWAELEGRPLSEVLLAEDRMDICQSLIGLIRDGRNAHGAHRLRTKDGRTRTLAWSARSPAGGPDRKAYILIVGNDITDLQEAQQRAVQAERLAAIGQMVAGLAHESRNALQRSQSCLSLLSFRLQNQPEALNLVERIQKAQDDLHHLFNDVRDYAASIQLELRVCDLAQVWRDAWEDLGAARANREAELREEIQVADRWCEVSPFHLKHVFRNVLENALSATEGPVRITICCTAVEVGGREGLQIAVQDNGPGFTAEQRHKAFEPFFTTKVRGTGLGLAICKRLVEAHGGQIAVGEGDGPGGVIRITLPRRST
jgi:PAS domain S-box-containing protein